MTRSRRRERQFGIAILLLIVGVWLYAIADVDAAPGGGWGVPSYTLQTARNVEQQTPGGLTQPDRSLWVTNPTQCPWGADDSATFSLVGSRLREGDTGSLTFCLIADWNAHLVGLWRSSSEIEVRLTVDAVSTYPVAVPLSYAMADQTICLVGPRYDSSYDGFVPIEGSNPDPERWGIGVWHTVTITAIAHPAKGKQIRDAGVTGAVRPGGYASAQDTWCPSGYPVTWGESYPAVPGPGWRVDL